MGVRRQLETTLAEIEHAGKRGFFEPARRYLQLVREQKVRDSENVTLLGSQILRQHRNRLREEELWLITEQVAIAAMDTKAVELAAELVGDIKRKFPSSQRAIRLAEMYFEARGAYDEAERVIAQQLEDAPESQTLLKRRVALEKTRGNIAGAIEALRKYVDTFQTDREAWEELGKLYLQVQMYPQAATCYEEVLIQNPACIASHVQYADVLYTIGGPSNYRTARTYYAAAVDLSNGENVRALYGLCAVSAQLNALKDTNKGKDFTSSKDVEELAVLAGRTLLQKYGAEAEDKVPLVLATLKAQGFAADAAS